LFSQAYHLTQRSTGRDLVHGWKINGKLSRYRNSFIYPWTDKAIVIKGIELLPFPKWQHVPIKCRWLMVGNSYVSDIMLMSDGDRTANFGLNFQFPGRDTETVHSYLDLHGHCFPGAFVSVMLNFFYEMDHVERSL